MENRSTLVRNYNFMLRGSQTLSSNYLIKQLPKATVFLNKRLQVVHASDSWVDYFHFSNDIVLGQNISELFGEISKDWKTVMNNCLKGKPSNVGVERFMDHENKEKWFEWSNIPWYDENENIIGIIIQTDDITTRLQNEIKLEKLEVLLREKSEIAKIGSWEYDILKDEISWSDMTKAIHEVPMNYVPTIEKGIDFYKQGYSRNTISMAVNKAMENGTSWNEKLQIITAKGNEKWVIAAGKPIFKDERLIGLIGTLQDVNDQVLSQTKTKENEHLLKTLIDHLPLNVFIKDKESRKVLVNKAECDYLGVKGPEEVLGKTDYDFYDEETANTTREDDLHVMNSMTPILGEERGSIKKNGDAITFLTSKIPLIGDDGIAYGLVGISMDISNLKQKEEELRDLINVTSLQNKKLVNFAHIVSHNLRSHTANFSMLLDFLIHEKDEEEKQNIIGMLIDASDNLLETLENLNEVVAISTNTDLEKKPINLNEKLKTVQQNLAAFLLNNNAKIVNSISDDVFVKVVPAYIESILMNFITNGVKYKDPERDPTITLSASSNNGYTIVSIADNGMGIDLKKYGDKLFGMYKTFHDKKDSRGIGLYITKNQIEAMNGKVMACSEVGKGTTFNIYFNEKD
ncbi:PAS domain-containing protein [Ulvibacterium sp.]|uniref:PAS domain-containing protein n=1 Tax=Ulvibacterium sp. TaxID=2665914 RepID=UPI002622F899|nr:PAS domain-containing protein [Ulvibacterium sp.]